MLENNFLIIIIYIIFPYLIGSIPFGLIFSKLNGYGDIRKIGSGNIGATNVLRTGNKKLALLVLFCDGFKGYLSIKMILIISLNNLSDIALCLALVSVVLGHCFPIWLKFNGGKGVATILGSLLALNVFLGSIILISWVIIALLFKKSSLSSLISIFCIPLPILILFNINLSISFFIVFLITTFRHKDNIFRLLQGKETNILSK